MNTIKRIIISVFVLLLYQTIDAQEKWGLQFRPGMNFATEDLDILDSQVGFGFEISWSYKFEEHFGLYTGWSWNTFRATEIDRNRNDLDISSFTFGLDYSHLINKTNLSYFARFGGIYNKVKLEDTNSDILSESDYGLGWEISAGIEIALGSSTWYLRPQMGFRSLSRDLIIENLNSEIKLNHIVLSGSVIKKF
ncbi:outer membrane beta-barrel protein [Spongiivirga citrea]|uniref:Outer membrane beta-barrel protein n=1 Tax=Spongiivirga citrea TaxID=1481457 RepID=A0A6M0CIF0_9FLAO|nr:outer membrane beta-barrel protein [Spongiivirga citrea]NER15734.1 outer membrane beta-barrel protein [Spongiivirga citrea]